MDPDTALATMRDELADADERADAAEALRGWILAGGYLPAGITPLEVEQVTR